MVKIIEVTKLVSVPRLDLCINFYFLTCERKSDFYAKDLPLQDCEVVVFWIPNGIEILANMLS